MNKSLSIGDMQAELLAAQEKINGILYGLYERIGKPVDIETLVRHGAYTKAEHAKQPIVLLSVKVDVND